MIWMNIAPHMAKSARYTMGARIENKFLDLLELSHNAYYSKKEEKTEKISKCIFILDTLKYLISVAWEAKLISHNKFEEIVQKLDEIGRMLGGWKNSLDNPEKKNRAI